VVKSLLLVEDEPFFGDELKRHYARQGWEVALARTFADAKLMLLEQHLAPLVVISDMNLPDGNGLDLLDLVRRENYDGEWILLTAYGSVQDSVRALRLGASEFIEKPCDLARLDLVVNGAARSARAQRRLKELSEAQARKFSLTSFAGHSQSVLSVSEMVQQLSRVPFSALNVTGETGTGKGLIARILHTMSSRSDGPMIEINCAALPRELVESELFGHESGSFTGAKGRRRGLFEQASGGTLFLDEVGELELSLQAKLLKSIEDRSIRRVGGEQVIAIDVQIITATNRDLAEQVRNGTFRSDLFHRLNAFSLHLPPLRERPEDIEDLVPIFISEFNLKAAKSVKKVSAEVWRLLLSYDWPGNVRELRNVVERCVLLSDGEEFPLRWLQLSSGGVATLSGGSSEGQDKASILIPLDGSMSLDDMDKFIIKTALARNDGNVLATARALGATRETLRYRMQKYGLK